MDHLPPSPKSHTSAPPSLTSLPEGVIESILTHLPIKEAVRTSILSTSFRHRWESIPDLNFGDDDDDNLPPSAVDSVLLLHSAAIHSFYLRTAHVTHAHRWILTLSRRNMAHNLHSLYLSFPHDGPHYLLHSSILSIIKTITHLSLSHCSLSLPPSFQGPFPSLKSLYLQDVEFPDDSQLSVLVCGSLALEDLTLRAVDPIGSLDLRNVKQLCSFTFHADCSMLRLAGGQVMHYISVVLDIEETDVDLDGLFRGVVCNGSLCFEGCTLTAMAKGNIPYSMPTNFQNLNSLMITVNLVDLKEISIMLCLMRSAPKLQELYIIGPNYEGYSYEENESGPGDDFWKGQENLNLFDNLRIVHLTYIMFQEPEMKFMKFVLARACSLERLTTICATETNERLDSALTELRESHRVSALAQITNEVEY